MSKKFTVITPCYNSSKTLSRLLDSIGIQDLDTSLYEVICMNDCSPEGSYEDIIEFYTDSFNVREMKYPSYIEENQGPGFARQYATDMVDTEYVMYIDSDDEFCGSSVFSKFYSEMEKGYDIISGELISEGKMETTYQDSIHVNGKCYKKEFLVKNNIRFCEIFEGSTSNEDIGFSIICGYYKPTVKYLGIPAIFWHDTAGSITHSTGWEEKNFAGGLVNRAWAVHSINNNEDFYTVRENAASVIVAWYPVVSNDYYLKGLDIEFMLGELRAYYNTVREEVGDFEVNMLYDMYIEHMKELEFKAPPVIGFMEYCREILED